MSDSVDFEWDFSGIMQDIEQMGKDIKKIENKVTKKASNKVKDKLKDNTPRSNMTDAEYKHMQDSIKVSSLKEDKETLDKYRSVNFGKLQYKANWLEEGTSKMGATHFLSKTNKETSGEVKKIIEEELKNVLK